MITGHTLTPSGGFTEIKSTEGATDLSVKAPTRNKDQLMVYVRFETNSGAGRAKLKFEMADPSILEGATFQMSKLDGTHVVPVELDVVQSGYYRVPVPMGTNETQVLVTATMLDTDPAQDLLEFWVTLDSYQPVSGMLI